MKPRVLDWLHCPVCASELDLASVSDAAPSTPSFEGSAGEIESGTLTCRTGHRFPIEDGVPRLYVDRELESEAARSIRRSFSAQWAEYDHEAQDKTWGQTLEQRIGDFLRMVGMRPEELEGKRVLDAGCGNGMLSRAITDFGCEVLAADLSDSVVAAHRHLAGQDNGRTHFVQADLMQPPFRPDTFDIVFCAGVLIVTPDSRRTFDEVIKAVAPGGRVFVWVYWREPGLKYRIKTALRRLISPLPLHVKRAVSAVFTAQALARGYLAKLLRREGAEEPTRWREAYLVQHDFFTPRYRWEHTEEEVHGWYREHGFVEMKTTEIVKAGFGVLARRPLEREQTEREKRIFAGSGRG